MKKKWKNYSLWMAIFFRNVRDCIIRRLSLVTIHTLNQCLKSIKTLPYWKQLRWKGIAPLALTCDERSQCWCHFKGDSHLVIAIRNSSSPNRVLEILCSVYEWISTFLYRRSDRSVNWIEAQFLWDDLSC